MTDSITSWLNAAGRQPLLPGAELVRLANLRDTLEPGSKAYIKVINKIVTHNLRLIPNVVSRYINKRTGFNMSSEVVTDLLQQGVLGLRRAAEKYDAKRGFSFATYAYPWIYQSVTRWHNSHDRSIYIPENAMTEVLYQFRHGEPSKSKNGRAQRHVLDAARHAMTVGTTDLLIKGKDDDVPLSDILHEDNRIIDREPTNSDWAALKLKDLMAECGIRPKTQDIVLAYAQRGRMSIVAARVKMSQKHCQNLYSDAVRTMKAHVEAKESAKAAYRAGRLGK